jgi:hypothetical protein
MFRPPPGSPAVPQVGIFWFIQGPGASPTLVGFGAPVREGVPYGDYINYPGEHSRSWSDVKQHLSLFFHDCEHKDWPRGRVMYNVYLHEQLQTPEIESEILAYFNLPNAETSFASDPHYAKARFMIGPEGPRARCF